MKANRKVVSAARLVADYNRVCLCWDSARRAVGATVRWCGGELVCEMHVQRGGESGPVESVRLDASSYARAVYGARGGGAFELDGALVCW